MAVPPQILTAIDNFLTIMTVIGAGLLGWFICLAGFYYMTSGGNPMGIQKSKDCATGAIIGFAVIVLARVIANMINSAIPR